MSQSVKAELIEGNGQESRQTSEQVIVRIYGMSHDIDRTHRMQHGIMLCEESLTLVKVHIYDMKNFFGFSLAWYMQ